MKSSISRTAALATLIICGLSAKGAAEGDGAVTAAMHHNFEALMRLQPLVSDPEAFRDDSNKDEIEKHLASLRQTGQALPALVERKKPDLKAMARVFSDYMTSAESNFKSGYRDYARAQVRAATGFCMACHTRSQGMQPFAGGEELIAKARLTDAQKAEYFAATRQYDKALEYYERAVTSGASDEMGLRDLTQAVRAYLSIAVRVKQDPALADAFLQKVAKVRSAADFFGGDLGKWRKDLAQWKAEKKSAAVKPGALMAQARRLVASARKSQEYPADHSADILYLRATNALHGAMEAEPRGKFKAEAFHLLGISYGALNDPLLWDLGSLYLEACVREVPHTPLARKCFRRFSDDIYQGYSGSGGVNVPSDQLQRLAELRKLAGTPRK